MCPAASNQERMRSLCFGYGLQPYRSSDKFSIYTFPIITATISSDAKNIIKINTFASGGISPPDIVTPALMISIIGHRISLTLCVSTVCISLLRFAIQRGAHSCMPDSRFGGHQGFLSRLGSSSLDTTPRNEYNAFG